MSKSIKTGYKSFDRNGIEFYKKTLTLLAGISGKGKTTFALNVAKKIAAEQGKAVVIITNQMSANLIRKKLNSEDLPIYIEDDKSFKPIDVFDYCQDLIDKGKEIGLIIVDDLTGMAGRRNSVEEREMEKADIARGLRIIARRLRVPVLAIINLPDNAVKFHSEGTSAMFLNVHLCGPSERYADTIIFMHVLGNIKYDSNDVSVSFIVVKNKYSVENTNALLNWDRKRGMFYDLPTHCTLPVFIQAKNDFARTRCAFFLSHDSINEAFEEEIKRSGLTYIRANGSATAFGVINNRFDSMDFTKLALHWVAEFGLDSVLITVPSRDHFTPDKAWGHFYNKSGEIFDTKDNIEISYIDYYLSYVFGDEFMVESTELHETEGHQIFNVAGRVLGIRDFKELYGDLK